MLQFIDALLGLYAGPEQDACADQAPAAGQGLVEYALILAFISIALFLVVNFFGARLTTIYSRLANSIPST